MRKAIGLLAVSVCTVWAGSAFAQGQIAPNPNPAGSTITLNGGGWFNNAIFYNDGTLDNNGTLNNSDALFNNGTLNNNVGGTLNNNGTPTSISRFAVGAADLRESLHVSRTRTS